MPDYKVLSYHFNVQGGDAAIHVLQADKKTVSTVLVDAGKGGPNAIHALRNFIYSKNITLDSVLITHWVATTTLACTSYSKPKKATSGHGDLKNSYGNFITRDGQTLVVKFGAHESVPITVLGPANLIGMDFFDLTNNAPTIAQAKTFKSSKELLDWHGKGKWQQNLPGAPGLFCVAQNWTYIGPPPGLGILDTESSTFTNQSSVAAMLIWPNHQISLYTAGDRDDLRETQIVAWSRCEGRPGIGNKGSCPTGSTQLPLGSFGLGGGDGEGQMKHFVEDNMMNLFRLPVSWQYLVNNQLGGSLNEANFAKYDHNCQGGPSRRCHINSFRCPVKFNPQNIIISAGSDYGHPRYESLIAAYTWNQQNKIGLETGKWPGEYRDFDKPIASTMFPYWLAKDRNNNW
ncbi:hypothetical protein B0T25DRAFT_574917 [Lasiosphaeria hispida]|uniref:Glycoside hydrolase family 5 domain-containing protein n=1 Tax=Lasiosphaeria hispida TaxID=260671 RepID=A0AAJ0H4U1_9PEZI|nr:hypothetical protein B0T25DRAFT_574917 [Lasiosphaeria hispida]